MAKEKELSKKDKLKFETEMLKRLSKVEQEVKLSGFDTTILASFFFFIAIYISLVMSGALKMIQINQYLFIGFFYLIIPMIAILFSIVPYIDSIISPNERFIKKINVLSYIWGTIIFVVGVWLLLLIVFLIENSFPTYNIPELPINIFMGALFLLTIIFTFKAIKPRLECYFKENYADICSKLKKKRYNEKKDIALIFSVIALVVALGGTYLAIQQLNLALYQIEYPNLNVTYQIDEKQGRLKLFVENLALKKETGTINFYRLEISDSKPHMQIDSLKPGENMTFDLAINITKQSFTLILKEGPGYVEGTIPYLKLYFATEESSISYKIDCDNCYPQGIVNRIPEPGMTEMELKFYGNKTIEGYLPIYSWITYSLEDLK